MNLAYSRQLFEAEKFLESLLAETLLPVWYIRSVCGDTCLCNQGPCGPLDFTAAQGRLESFDEVGKRSIILSNPSLASNNVFPFWDMVLVTNFDLQRPREFLIKFVSSISIARQRSHDCLIMREMCLIAPLLSLVFCLAILSHGERISTGSAETAITPRLFAELEEHARIVDISYCVGFTGVEKPFECASRCSDFPNFELLRVWNTGPLLSDSCGYIALDDRPEEPRLILAFRGTYSLASTIVDLSTIPQKYVPYPSGNSTDGEGIEDSHRNDSNCNNCTVHAGFLASWRNTRDEIIEDVQDAIAKHPQHRLVLIGHSLGGALALLASLEFQNRGWNPQVTTFGEPKVGNQAFVAHVDRKFPEDQATYRRITHINDPVPLLPLTEWGYRPHAGEIFISRAELPIEISDVRACKGDADQECSAGGDETLAKIASAEHMMAPSEGQSADWYELAAKGWNLVPARLRLWQLFFAHRDYFWRLGLCVKGGDPWDWKGNYGDGHAEMNEL